MKLFRGMLPGALVAGIVATKAVAGPTCVNDATQEAMAEIIECASYYLVVASGIGHAGTRAGDEG
jgi:hypothetical protein